MSDQPKVTRIAIGRLHNLGNYEHIRYDVTVELPDGAHDAGEVIHKLERLLGALTPVKKDYEYQSAVRYLSDPANIDKTEDEIGIYRARVEKHDRKMARRESALRAFSALGGVSTFTDAKAEWEDDDDYDY